MHNDNWDDLRFVLAVAETGTVSGAARRLGVNHATVLRRIAGYEDRHGVVIFEKSLRGYAVAPEHARMLEAAREVENAVYTVERALQGAQAPLRGTVRVTSTDTLCHHILPGVIVDLQRQQPELRIELSCTNAHLDLARLDAEITVRPARNLSDGLVGECPARLGFAVYALPGGGDIWLRLSGALVRSAAHAWMEKAVPADRCGVGADSFLVLRELAAKGAGRAILPCVLGDADARLARCDGLMPDIDVPLWVASHSDLATVPRVTVVRDALIQALRDMSAILRGRIEAA